MAFPLRAHGLVRPLSQRAYPCTDTAHAITRHTHSRSQAGERKRLSAARPLAKTSSAMARTWAGRASKKNLTQWLGSVSSALASAHRAIHIRGPGSRPGPRIAIGGRPLTAAVARGGAQSRSQKLALRAAPRYQHRCQNGLPWPTEVFSKRMVCLLSSAIMKKSKWVLACLFEEKTAGFCLTPMLTQQ